MDAKTPAVSERVRKVLELIKTGELSKKSLRALYDNACTVENITEYERELVIAELEKRIRISAPSIAKSMFGPKEEAARSLLGKFHDELAARYDLSQNTVGLGVKTGGDMISGETYVSVYISFKNADRWHATCGVFQKAVDTDPILVVRFYQTGSPATNPENRREFNLADIDKAKALYREHLEKIL